MSPNIISDGYEIHRKVICHDRLEILRQEADRVADQAGKACVRHLRSHSTLFDSLSTSEELLSLLPKGMHPVRSILFDKTESENWPVPWHQDLTISSLK